MEPLSFVDFGADDVRDLAPYFYARPNKGSYSSSFLCWLYNSHFPVRYCRLADGLLLIYRHGAETGALMPCCPAEKLPEYFSLLEKHFNVNLNRPLTVTLADEEGVAALRAAGRLDAYAVEESERYRDYIYDATDLRDLPGRKFSKKRNHIHHFLKLYDGRWKYRRLYSDDAAAIVAVLNNWLRSYLPDFDPAGGAIVDYPAELEEIVAEYAGIRNTLQNEALFEHLRLGGMFIDGRLEAFTIGDYNPREQMVVVSVEKANDDIPGLYQMINREFLLHEYPDARLVNREDDAGQENLRKAKLSYHPVMFARRFMLTQQGIR